MSSLLDLMWGDKQEENMVMEMLPFPPSIFFFFPQEVLKEAKN